MRIDQVMIKHMLNDEAVGQYAAAVRLSVAWYFIPVIVCNSLFPAILNAKKQSEELYYARLQKLYDLMVWMVIPIAMITTLVAADIVQFLYGAKFTKAAPVLAMHIWGSLFVFLGVVCGRWFLVENRLKENFLRNLIGALTNVILNLLLIPRYGINGVAVASIISYSVIAYFSLPLFRNTKKNLLLITRSLFFISTFETISKVIKCATQRNDHKSIQ